MYHYYCLVISLVLLFLYGFFPISTSPKMHQNDLPFFIGDFKIPNIKAVYPRHFQKTVLVIIDALRTDFVTPKCMPFTSKMVQSHGCLSNVKVESPTVTLPRIKAMTSGHIPQFVDLIKNLASSEVLNDSWLHSAKEVKLKMVFYGDENWISLFPDVFERYEGTSSFYVKDFTEVDNNVTKNVNFELERKDWDVMILHYLGLDHIGHVHGPFSNRVPPKLLEMDDIIKKIHNKIAVGEKTMILVTGDHGMRDSGGHGGTTEPEVNVPLAVLGPICQNSSFLQTDIPANLAVSMGIRIPSTSIGQIKRSFLNFLTDEQYLYALHYNTGGLLKLKNLCKTEFDRAAQHHAEYLKTGDKNHAELAKILYQNCSKLIADNLFSATQQQDIFLLILSILSMASVLTIFFVSMLTAKDSNMIFEFFVIALVNLSNLLTKTEVLSYTSVLVLVFLIATNIAKCYILLKPLPTPGFLNVFLIAMCSLHPLTLFSTSLIEEEQYFWYYFCTTFFLLLTIQHLNKSVISGSKLFGLILTLICFRAVRELNNLEFNDNFANYLNKKENYILHKVVLCSGLALTFFTLTKLKEISRKQMCFYIVILSMIFFLKIESQHSVVLGKIIWLSIFLEFSLFSKLALTKNICILVGSLLLKPHNIILIPVAVLVSKLCLNPEKSPLNLSLLTYLCSNYFYWAQGHRNSLASVDISVGYIGLNEYIPTCVITQNLIHIFIFMIIFNTITLEDTGWKTKSKYWLGLFMLKSTVVLVTFIDLVAHRHHLFIWSVFAPKLFIENVHIVVLFVQVSFCYFYQGLRLFFRNYCLLIVKTNKKD